MVKDNLSANLSRVKRSFQPYQKEHDSVKDRGEKGKNHVTLTWKFAQKSCSTSCLPYLSPNPMILKALWKTLPTKMKPTKCPAKGKKMRRQTGKKRGGEKAKVKVKTAESLFNPKTWDFDFCSAWSSQGNILHLIRRLWSAWPVNGFTVSFNSL